MIHDIKRFQREDIVSRRYINDLNKRAYKKQVVKSVAGILATAIAVILITDMIGFFGWAMSGQRPVDNFYLGSITTHTLQAVTK